MLHRKQAMKRLVPRPIKFYKILRSVTRDARLWSQNDVRCICGRQFTFLSFPLFSYPPFFFSSSSVFNYCVLIPLILPLLVLHLFYLLCFCFLPWPISVLCFYLLHFFIINISYYSKYFVVFFMHYAQNLLLFRYQCISKSVFTQCHRAGAKQGNSRSLALCDMGQSSSSQFSLIFIELYSRHATLSLSSTNRTDFCVRLWRRRAVATEVQSFRIILGTADFWYQRQEGIWLQLICLEKLKFWTSKQMENICLFHMQVLYDMYWTERWTALGPLSALLGIEPRYYKWHLSLYWTISVRWTL